jgi:tetratricopeptide (TPR) repeat protein
MTYISLLARLFYDPPHAISALRAARPLVPALLAASFATIGYFALLSGLAQDLVGIARVQGFDVGGAGILVAYLRRLPLFLVPVILIATLYVPTCLFFLGAFGRADGPVETLRREYGTTLSVALSAWAATLTVWALPAAVFVDPYSPASTFGWTALPALFFVIPMSLNLARVDGATAGRAVFAALLGGVSLIFARVAIWFTVLLTSPIVLIVLFFVFRGVLRDWSSARDSRERFERGLEAATLNPADASAHVNLGLIYQQRGDLGRAADHLRRAVEIDPEEADALYQLGRIARMRGQFAEAIARFDPVVQLDDAHANSEVWREIGATYYAAGQFEDARSALERFLDRRPSDAEGLYTMGMTLDALGLKDEARESMEAVVDALRTAPTYKYRLDRRWLREAQSYLSRNR